MKTYPHHLLTGVALGLMLAVPSATAAKQASAPIAEATQTDTLDPAALNALEEMGKALRALQHFTVISDATTEIVLDTGQKIELDGRVTYKVQPPQRMFVELDSDRIQRQLFYDGSALTIFSPRLNYYASTENVGKTLAELLITAARDYGIELPLADLFFWGTEHVQKNLLSSAIYVGPGTLDGMRVDQYAFRQPGVDWQIWIAPSTSLPQKIVISSLGDPAVPQYASKLSWDTRSAIDAETFVFTPPEGSVRIRLVEVEAVAIEVDEEN
ncbi:DUF2092 domain-containing protein [Lysobacter sp. F60174L2]|uniref:DUF2092 domain-containing protein n=1 Tax=Lysobacter sp. F60174L2 TaxID=3459295 RepID=UPI00403D67DA